MIKRFVVFLLVITFLLVGGYTIHTHLIGELNPRFEILDMYIFHSISSLFVYVIIELVGWKLPDQAGYAFLASVFLKIGFFSILFSEVLTSEIPLEMFERYSIVIPLFLFLLPESIFSARLLNSK